MNDGPASHPPLRVLVAGGGTGGHLFPGIAIAQEFMARQSKNRILFVGTKRSFEKTALKRVGFDHRSVSAEGIKGRGPWKAARAAVKVPIGVVQSLWIMQGFKPDLVLGVGGYVSGPVVLAGWLRRTPVALHEQNLVPGITNRLLSSLAGRVFASFEGSRAALGGEKVRVTGNPVRIDMRETPLDPDNSVTAEDFTVLVVGGSQGAHRINTAVIEALDHLADTGRYRFIHQTGPADETLVTKAYAGGGFRADVRPFFHDMVAQYHRADLLICRAGATTVAEVTVLGKAAVFVPFPFAADDHQTQNARSLADSGAAAMIPESELDGRVLAETIQHFAGNPGALEEMARRARQFGRPDAARAIVDECYRLAAGGPS